MFLALYLMRLCKSLLPGFLLCCLLSGSSWGQTGILQTEFFTIKDGLSDRLITDIFQIDNGFLWLATPNGLNRFDGYEFLVFNNHPENINQISGTNIKNILKDKAGNLILIYQNNYVFFDLFNPNTFDFQKISLFPDNGIKGIVRDIQVNPQGEVLILSISEEGTHIYRYTQHGFDWLFLLEEKHEKQSATVSFIQLSNNSFLLNDSEKGIRFLNPKGGVVKVISPSDFDCLEKPEFYPGSCYFLKQDKTGRVWLSLVNMPGLYLFHPETQSFRLFDQMNSGGLCTRLWEDQQGNILLANTTGIGKYPLTKNLFCVSNEGKVFNFNYLLEVSDHILSLCSGDFFKTIYMGIDTGFKIIQNNRSKITTFLQENVRKDQFGAVMRGITGDGKGTVYFAREVKNWYALDLNTDFLDTITLVDENSGVKLDFDCSMDLLLDKKDQLWGISCYQFTLGQLHKYDPESCSAKTYVYEFSFNAFTQSKDGLFWILCETPNGKGQLISFNPGTEKFSVFSDAQGNNPLKNGIPSYITESKDGSLWIGTSNGLVVIDPNTLSSKIYGIAQGENNRGLSGNAIYVIYEDEKGLFWIGTNNGLNILNPETGEVQVFDEQDGLPNNSVCGLIPDEKGNYWISTYNGLSYFDRENKLFRNFYKANGLTHDEFNRFSFFKDERGRYYFGSVNGINAFYPEDLLITEKTPSVILTKFVRYNSKSDSLISQYSSLANMNEVKVSAFNTYFQLHFTLPDFTHSRKNQYSAWLQGYDNDWTYLGTTSNIRYNNLPADKYTLLIRGAGPNGNWSEEVLSIDIDVKQKYLKSWWFYTLLFLLFLALGYAFFLNRLKSKINQERFRMKLSSDLHDEVSGLLSGIAMQTDVLQMISKDEESKSRLQTIGEVSRKAMSIMSDVIWSIDSRKDRVKNLMERMREHADDMLLPLNIKYDIQIGQIDQEQKIPVTIRQDLYFIFKEAINNIAKHSSATKVSIRIRNNRKDFEMVICDNGNPHGKFKASHKTGQGLSNMQMRAHRLHAKLDIVRNGGYTIKVNMKKFV